MHRNTEEKSIYFIIFFLNSQGHYRYCEALFSLKEHRKAIDANALAQSMCIHTSDGLKDLVQQHQRFISEMTEKGNYCIVLCHLDMNMTSLFPTCTVTVIYQ